MSFADIFKAIAANAKAIEDKKNELLIQGSSPVINQINGIIATFLGQLQPDMKKDNYIQPSLTPLLTNNCNSYNAELQNSNPNCLAALIETCNIDIINKNNVISYKNCSAIQDYAKSYALKQQTDINNSINYYRNNEFTDWTSQISSNDCRPKSGISASSCDPVCALGAYKNWGTDIVVSVGGISAYAQHGNCDQFWDMGDCGCKSPQFGTLKSLYSKLNDVINPFITNVSNITCPNLPMVPTAPITCCNNTINCLEFAECSNIVQMCVLGTNGETEISNAVECMLESCPLNGQKCIAGAEGAGGYNWVCQENKWIAAPAPPAPPPAPPPPAQSPPPPAPSPSPTTPTPTPTPTTPSPTPTPVPIPSLTPVPTLRPIINKSSTPTTQPQPIRIFRPSSINNNEGIKNSSPNTMTLMMVGGVVIVIIIIFIIFYNMS